jgi:hypothetical protein
MRHHPGQRFFGRNTQNHWLFMAHHSGENGVNVSDRI